MAFLSKVVTALVAWAVVVSVWMVMLSVDGSWNQCKDGRTVEGKVTPGFFNELRRSPRPRAAQTTPITTPVPTEATTTQSVQQQRLARYFSNIMHGPDSMPVGRSGKYSLAAEENCTAVILAYKPQATTLSKVISHYCRVPFLEAIYIVWNSVNETIPHTLRMWERKCYAANLTFIRSDANRVINRYLQWEKIKTDCVCFLDDDTIVSSYDMILGYEVWQNFRYQLVGFQEASFYKHSNGSYEFKPFQPRRYIGMQYKKSSNRVEIRNGTRILVVGNKTYVLGKSSSMRKTEKPAGHRMMEGPEQTHPDGYSIMGGPSFVHRSYLEMYFDPQLVPTEAVQHVKDINNCEDILLSIVVTKFLQDTRDETYPGVLTMKASLSIKHFEKEERREVQLSKRPNYYAERSECLNLFSQLYGYLPLKPTNNIITLV